MQRYFIEVSYKGTHYSGFQVQHNAPTIQSALEKALFTLFRQNIVLTGSSRTDAGVHALQNFFHFDTDLAIARRHLYNINAILPHDISVKNMYPVNPDAHCRFNAVSREYKYFIYRNKDPFLYETAWYYPFTIDIDTLHSTAAFLLGQHDFTSFSKRNTQVKTFNCTLEQSQWSYENECLVYTVTANRFLRGMVRGLVSTMLKLSRSNLGPTDLAGIIESKDCRNADFSAPPHGLFLMKVNYDWPLTQID